MNTLENCREIVKAIAWSTFAQTILPTQYHFLAHPSRKHHSSKLGICRSPE